MSLRSQVVRHQLHHPNQISCTPAPQARSFSEDLSEKLREAFLIGIPTGAVKLHYTPRELFEPDTSKVTETEAMRALFLSLSEQEDHWVRDRGDLLAPVLVAMTELLDAKFMETWDLPSEDHVRALVTREVVRDINRRRDEAVSAEIRKLREYYYHAGSEQ